MTRPMLHIQNDTEHTVGSFIGATFGIIKSIFSVSFLHSTLLSEVTVFTSLIETCIFAFCGGLFGYLGTSLTKWVHNKLKKN